METCSRNCGCEYCMRERNRTIQKFMKFRDIVASYDPKGNLINEGLLDKLIKNMAARKKEQTRQIQTAKKSFLAQVDKKEKEQKEKEQTLINKSHLYAYPEGYSKEEQKSRRTPRVKKGKLPLDTSEKMYKPFDFKKSADFSSLKKPSKLSSSKESDEDWLNRVFGEK